MEPLLSVRHLVKTFDVGRKWFGKTRQVHAVNDISFDIKPGETFSLVGESGCGKSTTGKLINRLITPNSGEIWFEGKEISKVGEKNMRLLRSNMQMIFQDPNGSLNPRMRIEDIVSEPLLVHTELSAEQRMEKVGELLENVGLNANYTKRFPFEFSGGQRQRIGIARAISVRPKLIIADEPVSALDVSIQAQVLNILQSLQKKYQLTYLFISHDLSVVEMISDRIAVMYLGTIVETAEKNELYANPLHPYTRALLSAIPIPDPKAKKDRIILKGDIPSAVEIPSGCPFHTRCPIATEKCKLEKPVPKTFNLNHIVSCHYVERNTVDVF
ncbi:MAG: oligopeptide/dipeptide ABC transporter ATP-binding protein [Sporolactobacillus sp.]